MKKTEKAPKKSGTTSKPKKSWNEKMMADHSQVKRVDIDFADIKSGSIMYISNPKTIEDYIRSIPKGKSVDLKTMRKDLAIEHGAEVTCPITTGIFLRIVAEAAYEKYEQGTPLSRVTPFWRVIHEKMPIAKKLSFGVALVRDQRKKEGMEVDN